MASPSSGGWVTSCGPTSASSPLGGGEVVVEPDGSLTGRLLLSLVESDGHPVLQTQPDWTLREGADRVE